MNFIRFIKIFYLNSLRNYKGNSSSSGRAPICGFGWFGSSPKYYPIRTILLGY